MRIETHFGQNYENGTDFFSPEWTLGSCNGWIGKENETHFYRCCLQPGQHTLTCINKKSEFGWGNVTFRINGKRYCDDFVGFKAMRTILFEGKKNITQQFE